MPGHDAKSHLVGPATLSDGGRATAYRAVTSLVCVQCRGRIERGQVFSRRAQHAIVGVMGTLRTEPVCVTCRPLRLEEDADGPASLGGEHHEGCHEG